MEYLTSLILATFLRGTVLDAGFTAGVAAGVCAAVPCPYAACCSCAAVPCPDVFTLEGRNSRKATKAAKAITQKIVPVTKNLDIALRLVFLPFLPVFLPALFFCCNCLPLPFWFPFPRYFLILELLSLFWNCFSYFGTAFLILELPCLCFRILPEI